MRSTCRARALLMAVMTAVLAGAAFGTHPAAAVDPLNPNAPCSVFDGVPCNPSFCSVYGPWPCVPSYPSIGQDRRLTIHARSSEAGRAPEGPVNSIRDLFAALRACWEPPPLNESRPGMQMSVRFSFKRTGELVAPAARDLHQQRGRSRHAARLWPRRRRRARALHADAVQQGDGRRHRRPADRGPLRRRAEGGLGRGSTAPMHQR